MHSRWHHFFENSSLVMRTEPVFLTLRVHPMFTMKLFPQVLVAGGQCGSMAKIVARVGNSRKRLYGVVCIISGNGVFFREPPLQRLKFV